MSRSIFLFLISLLLVSCNSEVYYYGFSKRTKDDSSSMVTASSPAGLNYDTIAGSVTDVGIDVVGVEEIGTLVMKDGIFVGFKTADLDSIPTIKKRLKKEIKRVVPNGYKIYIGEKEEVVTTLHRLSLQLKGQKLSQAEMKKRIKDTIEPLKQ